MCVLHAKIWVKIDFYSLLVFYSGLAAINFTLAGSGFKYSHQERRAKELWANHKFRLFAIIFILLLHLVTRRCTFHSKNHPSTNMGRLLRISWGWTTPNWAPPFHLKSDFLRKKNSHVITSGLQVSLNQKQTYVWSRYRYVAGNPNLLILWVPSEFWPSMSGAAPKWLP